MFMELCFINPDVIAGSWTLPGHHQTAAVSAFYRETAFTTFTYIGAFSRPLLTSVGHKHC